MERAKLTEDLATRLKRANASDIVDVVVELHQPPESKAPGGARSRHERMSVQKDAFSRAVAPVEETIRSVGGEVTGLAWINQTVRARVPAEGVGRLSDLKAVATLDTPHALHAEHAERAGGGRPGDER